MGSSGWELRSRKHGGQGEHAAKISGNVKKILTIGFTETLSRSKFSVSDAFAVKRCVALLAVSWNTTMSVQFTRV